MEKYLTHVFFSCPSYLPFWSYAPLKKSEWNLMHAISYEPCMLGFWNFIYGFLMEKYLTHVFFSCPSYLPFWSYAPLKKSEWNLMHAISYEPCMLGFWNFIYGFLMEKYLTHVFFFLSELSPFLELCPFEKFWMKSDACHILWTVHARVLKFHIWIPHGKIADPYVFLVWDLSFWSYAPLKKSEWNLVSKISQNVFELGVWNLVSL